MRQWLMALALVLVAAPSGATSPQNATLLSAKAPAGTPPTDKVKCTNFDSPENCARREAAQARATREKQLREGAATSSPPEDDITRRNPDGSISLPRVLVEAEPEDYERPALSAQQKLEKAWGERDIPNGTIAYRGNDGTRVECDGAALRNRKRMGLLSYLLPIPACASSPAAGPGYLERRP
jgi:hypothetical protein